MSILSEKLINSELSSRAKGLCERLNLLTIRDLIEKDPVDFKRQPNIGKTTLQEVNQFIEQKKIDLIIGGDLSCADKSLADFHWSARVAEFYEQKKLITVHDIFKLPNFTLTSIPSLGEKSKYEIERFKQFFLQKQFEIPKN